jgi:hypothetical protein
LIGCQAYSYHWSGFSALVARYFPIVPHGLPFDSVKEGQYGTKSAAGVIQYDRAEAMAATNVTTNPTDDKPASHRL